MPSAEQFGIMLDNMIDHGLEGPFVLIFASDEERNGTDWFVTSQGIVICKTLNSQCTPGYVRMVTRETYEALLREAAP